MKPLPGAPWLKRLSLKRLDASALTCSAGHWKSANGLFRKRILCQLVKKIDAGGKKRDSTVSRMDPRIASGAKETIGLRPGNTLSNELK